MDENETQSVLSAIVFGLILEDNPQEKAVGTIQVLSKIILNALSSDDPKFRKLPVGNEKIKEKILNVSGAAEFLDAVGFIRADGQGDFVLTDDSKLPVAASLLADVSATLPKPVATPVATKPQVTTTQLNTKASSDVDAEYESRRREAEARQAEIKHRMEEDRRKKEALQKQFKQEQKESKERPVVASRAVHVGRADDRGGSSGAGDGKIRYTNTDREFQSVVGSQSAVIANFTASWCGPCQSIAPMIEDMARKNPKITFIKIDIDENSETPSRFNVSAVPTFILFKNGQVAGEVKGANPQGVQSLVAKA